MKRQLTFRSWALLSVAIALAFLTAPTLVAQTEANDLTALQVELWPDYDRPSMLVLMNITLPPTAELPATVNIPLPPGAEVNAVARMSDENQLMADVVYAVNGDTLTITVNDHFTRVEYYAPYESNGTQRTYSFDWLADLNVGQLAITVQEPAAAENLTTTPAAVNVSENRGDDLRYHALPARSVPAGETFTVGVSYDNPTGALTVPLTDPNETAASTGQIGVGLAVSPWWVAAVIGLALVALGAWYLGRRQGAASGRTRKPTPNRGARPQPANETARYCHECGRKAETGDSYCRQCGTPLKTAS